MFSVGTEVKLTAQGEIAVLRQAVRNQKRPPPVMAKVRVLYVPNVLEGDRGFIQSVGPDGLAEARFGQLTILVNDECVEVAK